MSRPKTPIRATLDDIQWICGTWSGKQSNEFSVEHWGMPHKGELVCYCSHYINEGLQYIDLLALKEVTGYITAHTRRFRSELEAIPNESDTVKYSLVIMEDKRFRLHTTDFGDDAWLTYELDNCTLVRSLVFGDESTFIQNFRFTK